MNKFFGLLLILFVFSTYSLTAQKKTTESTSVENAEAIESVNWLNWKELETAYNKEPKKVFVDIYTSWCGWCKKLDKTTFKDPAAVKYINENFYAVKFDAEKQEDITFNGTTYKFIKNGKRGYSELAYNFMQGRMSFPTMVFLNDDLSILTVIPSYLDAPTWDAALHYFGDGVHLKGVHWETHLKDHTENRNKSEIRF